ncbi:MAG: HEAT repeat domain-containing protein [Myxococcales bacterium]
MNGEGFTATARTAWAVGVLEALGALRDPRATPAVLQVLRSETDPETVRASALALGQISPDTADSVLLPLAMNPGPMQLPVVAGLGECRTVDAAQGLAQLLSQVEGDDELGRTAAQALGQLACSWVWQRPAWASRPERAEIATVAARGLLTAFVRSSGQTRVEAERNLLVVDFADLAPLLEKAKAEHPDQRMELEKLARRLANNPLHRK